MGFGNLFQNNQPDDSVAAKKNWYSDRYQTVIVQRNFLLLICLISVVGIMVSVLTVIQVTSSKKVEPFVIEIEEKTGITNVIRPLLKEKFAYDEALRRYFVMKYMNARETYDSGSYQNNYYKVVKMLSNSLVYSQFKREISTSKPDSPLKLGALVTITIKIKSMTLLKNSQDKDSFTMQIRFVKEKNTKNGTAKTHLVSTLTFVYDDLLLTTEQRDINPLGFRVTTYRKDKEVL